MGCDLCKTEKLGILMPGAHFLKAVHVLRKNKALHELDLFEKAGTTHDKDICRK